MIRIRGHRFKVSHEAIAGVCAGLCAGRMDGQSARHGQMCKKGFSIEGGITQRIKLAVHARVYVCFSVCARACACMFVCVVARVNGSAFQQC